jgi:hypothetical protein
MSTSYSLSQLHDVHAFINQEKNFSRSLLIRIEGRKTEREGHLGHVDDLMPLFVIMSIPTIPHDSPGVIFITFISISCYYIEKIRNLAV